MIGIYKITSPTGRIYIGQSIDIKRRFDTYRRIDFGVKTSPKLHRSLMKYGDHKRKISENSGSARIVLNTQNGVFYNSAKEAAKAHGFKSNSLVCRLIGKIKNKSNLIYA